ncbi:type II secretion system protein [Romboutsia sp.]|uniref:type II secretion system protein n=1 Tax=Romboutsia sp. TaxID=1965302 RepID=UPI002BDDBFAD|nr:type II secretion system protein [Romboutsia sp.]HSQ88774.1 type II secretion system protein [Romboutsia sp.]
MKNKKRRAGFTLVEMVIVVTILGVLSSLGFMKFGQVQENARLNSDYVAASSLATATNLALNDKSVTKDSNGEVKISDLVETKYLRIEPVPQSEEGVFEIVVDSDSSITIKVGEIQFYPKTTADSVDNP